jgi:hypothetical protein
MQIVFPLFYLYIYQLGFSIQKYDPRFWPFLRTPVQWSSAYILPIYKSGDSSMPENYRGIAINSCIGKLFNTVLNNRLDKYLIDNNLIK